MCLITASSLYLQQLVEFRWKLLIWNQITNRTVLQIRTAPSIDHGP